MKCPKCKKEMYHYDYGNTFGYMPMAHCINKKCEWVGIKRDMDGVTND